MKTYSRHDFTREERAARAKVAISAAFESKEQAFLDFVLSHYVRVGVQELDQEKLTPLLRLKYINSIADAVAHLADRGESHHAAGCKRSVFGLSYHLRLYAIQLRATPWRAPVAKRIGAFDNG